MLPLSLSNEDLLERTMDTNENSQLARDPPILRLSPALRRQIYSHLHDALGRMPCSLHLHGGNGKAALVIPALLLSCRRIYDEVSQVLYSTNYFDIKCEGAGSLQRIRNLSDRSLSLLTELKFVLNEASCHHESCDGCCDEYKYCHPEGCCAQRWHDQALRPSEYSANNLLRDWGLTAAYIWRRVESRKLNIAFVCDFDPQDPSTFTATRLAMAPLINLSPLRGPHIRLCRTRQKELEQIARNSVLQACEIVREEEPAFTLKNATVDSGSTLMSLPRELRFRILEYTDLITPWEEIKWDQKLKKYLSGHKWCGDSQLDCGPGGHYACQFKRCWTDFITHDPQYGYRLPEDPRPRVGCFCRIRHAAFSFNCRCWSPPTDLFLVCRALCKDAQATFFSGQRFAVCDYDPGLPWEIHSANYPEKRFAVVEFLKTVVPVDSVRQIRSLDVFMSTYARDSWPWEGSRTLNEWKDTVQFMKENMNIEGLTLHLYLADHSVPVESMTKSRAREVLQAYYRVLAPLAGLGDEGLKAFSACIWLSPNILTLWDWGSGYKMKAQVERMLSASAERLVMGSRYSEQREGGFRWGIDEPEDDLWHHVEWLYTGEIHMNRGEVGRMS